jgi:putative GTP pyrophosphokinase
MAWPIPNYTKNQVNKAGDILRGNLYDIDKVLWDFDVIDNWRSCHGYPINTFQATLMNRIKSIEPHAIVAQRLKRVVSIINKLRRFKSMQLSRMEDIGGLRAIVANLKKVRMLESIYEQSRFTHEFVSCRDYIDNPKRSGYRSIHLVYRYRNPRAPDYDGLFVELQLRTKLQHAWATAVETIGTFLDHALKSSEGPEIWLDFFALTGSAFAYLEGTQPVPGYEYRSKIRTFQEVIDMSNNLNVIEKLIAYSIAARRVYSDKRSGRYHLIILNPNDKTVTITSYSQGKLEEATHDYSNAEKRIANGETIQAVLVSAGPIDRLRQAYPNYFLDTKEFIKILRRIEKLTPKHSYRQKELFV